MKKFAMSKAAKPVLLSEDDGRVLALEVKNAVRQKYAEDPSFIKADEAAGQQYAQDWNHPLVEYAAEYASQRTGHLSDPTIGPDALKSRENSVRKAMGENVGENALRDARDIVETKLTDLGRGDIPR